MTCWCRLKMWRAYASCRRWEWPSGSQCWVRCDWKQWIRRSSITHDYATLSATGNDMRGSSRRSLGELRTLTLKVSMVPSSSWTKQSRSGFGMSVTAVTLLPYPDKRPAIDSSPRGDLETHKHTQQQTSDVSRLLSSNESTSHRMKMCGE